MIKDLTGPYQFYGKPSVNFFSAPTEVESVDLRLELREDQICASPGFDKSIPKAISDPRKKQKLNLQECKAACQSTRGCQSFANSKDKCMLYTAPVQGNFRSDSSSPYKFYDVSCSLSGGSDPRPASSTPQANPTTSSSTRMPSSS